MLTSPIVIGLALAVSCVSAHMQLTFPAPFNSSYATYTDYTDIDYSMTAPLFQDGSNYPCKGYHKYMDSVPVSATIVAGSTSSISLTGSATHGGGSCQISVSYDKGATWAVLHDIVGGCPLTSTYSYAVPAGLPAADKALLAWSWFNKIGNREMYSNCAPVTIKNSDPNAVLVPVYGLGLGIMLIGFCSAPRAFRANTFADGTCKTVEGDEVVFPLSAATRELGGMWVATPPKIPTTLSNCPYDESVMLTISGSSVLSSTTPSSPSTSSTAPGNTSTSTSDENSNEPSDENSNEPSDENSNEPSDENSNEPSDENSNEPSDDNASETSEDNASETSEVEASSTLETSTSSPPVKSPASTNVPVTPVPGSCQADALLCGAGGATFSQCSNGVWVFSGSVAQGTSCFKGKIVTKPSAASCKTRDVRCSSNGKTWSMCANGAFVNMGSVPAGTTCINGVFVAPRKTRKVGHVFGKAAQAAHSLHSSGFSRQKGLFARV